MALRLEQLPAEAPALVAAALMLVLACVLLSKNFSSRAIRAFSLVLILRGMSLLTARWGVLQTDPAEILFWFNLYPYFIVPLAVATVYFLSVYPHRRAWVPRGPWGAWPFLAAIAVLDLLYLLDHRMFSDLGAVAVGTSPLRAPPGPLFPFVDLWDVAFAAGALVLVRDYLRAPEGPRRRSMLLISVGFGCLALFDAMETWLLLEEIADYPGRILVLAVLPAVLVLAAGALLARQAASEPPGSPARTSARRYLSVLALVAASVVLQASLGAGTLDPLRVFFTGAWRLALPVLATYALLRHQLLGIDLKVKWTIKQSTVAAAFIGMFFVVSEAAQSYFSESLGPFLGIAAAGALVFALAPLQRVAERVATVAVPGARPLQDLSPGERAHIYLDNARVAWADGVLDRNERAMLDRLRDSLGLSVEDAVRLEQQAARPG